MKLTEKISLSLSIVSFILIIILFVFVSRTNQKQTNLLETKIETLQEVIEVALRKDLQRRKTPNPSSKE
jgi:YbbR domain-containing protein